MLIKSIKFSKYKSIVDSIEIDLSSPMITFIGKNGSGKTNILDAIYHTFQRDNHLTPQNMDYHIFLELDEHEIQKYSNFVEITNETNIIEAYREGDNNSPTLQIDRIKSPLMTSMIDNLSDAIHELAEKLRDSLTSTA